MSGTGGTAESPAALGQRLRWVLFHSIDGDLRFISHHDTLRLFRRAFARAGLPLRYSQGFNPHPKMTIPLPRPVGIASDAEAVVFELAEGSRESDVNDRLREQLPADLRFKEGRRLSEGERLVPVEVAYRIAIPEGMGGAIAERIACVRQASELIVSRLMPGEAAPRRVDIRPYLKAIDLHAEAVHYVFRIEGGRSARPAEVAELLGFQGITLNHLIRRTHVAWAS